MPTFTAKKTKLASELHGTQQERLMCERMMDNRCMECGAPRDSVSDFCRACLDKAYKKTQIGCAFDAWEYYVIQCKPALPETEAFCGMRIGVYERKGKQEYICFSETFEDARTLVLKKYQRAGGYAYAACA